MIKTAFLTLIRSPLRSVLVFVLLLAVAFIFAYNVNEYALTAREFERTVNSYQGVFTVERGEPEYRSNLHMPTSSVPNETVSGMFLMSDRANPAYDSEYFPYELYHQKSLAIEQLAELADLPYVSDTATRYIAAGISDKYERIENRYEYYESTFRAVLEATFDGFSSSDTLTLENVHAHLPFNVTGLYGMAQEG